MEIWTLLGKPELTAVASGLDWHGATSAGISVTTLVPGSVLHDFISQEWNASCGPFRLHRVDAVDAPSSFAGFKAMAIMLGNGRSGGHLDNPLNPECHRFREYQDGLDRLKTAFIGTKSPEVPRFVNFLFTFHGTRHDLAHRVAATGPRPLRTTDAGFFGAGSYTALEAAYAARYSILGGSGAAGSLVMVMFAAVVGAAYVMTRRLDYTGKCGPDVSNFYSNDPDKAIALKGQHDSHFIPVKDFGGALDYQACDEAEAEGHELVSQNFMQLCPIALLHFR